MKIKLLLLTFLLTPFLVFAGSIHSAYPGIITTQSKLEIQNNREATPLFDQFKFYARVFIIKENDTEFSYQQVCGASILDSQHILTAAHCVKGLPRSNYRRFKFAIVVNNINEHPNYKDFIPLAGIHLHPNYNDSNYNNDIAILTLKDPITTDFTSIKIPSYKDVLYYKKLQSYLSVGMGELRAERKPLHRLTMSKMRPSTDIGCSSVIKNLTGSVDMYPANGASLCVLPLDKRNICDGDSGGPLSYIDEKGEQQQIGVASYGFSICSDYRYPSVFTEIYLYRDWIESVKSKSLLRFTPKLTHP